ncbi:protein of unknown function [Agrobacterium pusense]|uniref:Uncharacterized protein n=1 Tax=Agrobacterium pusense TaxID=648995 RepID=U4Q8N6_9HYPH|nr:protein of unknown function [Agrobacterium pusense]
MPPAACAKSGGTSPVGPISSAPAPSASRSGGPEENSDHLTSMPRSFSSASSAPWLFASAITPFFCQPIRNVVVAALARRICGRNTAPVAPAINPNVPRRVSIWISLAIPSFDSKSVDIRAILSKSWFARRRR